LFIQIKVFLGRILFHVVIICRRFGVNGYLHFRVDQKDSVTFVRLQIFRENTVVVSETFVN